MKIVRRIAIVVFILCILGIGFILWTYLSQSHAYTQLADEVVSEASTAEKADKLAGMTVDWEKLRSENPDIVAWIRMPGTKIDYPVVIGDDNSEYLHKAFSGSEGSWTASAGTIFADSNCKKDLSNANVVMFGHHMRDGSMFAQIAKLVSQSEFNEHRTFYVLTPTMNYEVKTVACTKVKGSDTTIVKARFANQKAHTAYLKKLQKSASAKATDVNLNTAKKSFVLATCEYSQTDGRALLVGVVTKSAKPEK